MVSPKLVDPRAHDYYHTRFVPGWFEGIPPCPERCIWGRWPQAGRRAFEDGPGSRCCSACLASQGNRSFVSTTRPITSIFFLFLSVLQLSSHSWRELPLMKYIQVSCAANHSEQSLQIWSAGANYVTKLRFVYCFISHFHSTKLLQDFRNQQLVT